MTPFQENIEVDALHWADESLKNEQEVGKEGETYQGMSVESCKEKKVDSRPAVKVGQWWKWNEVCPMPHTAGDVFEMIPINEKKHHWFARYSNEKKHYLFTRYSDGQSGYAYPEDILDNATLILDPEWPIEVGDRFEDAEKRYSNGAIFTITDKDPDRDYQWGTKNSENTALWRFRDSSFHDMRRLPREEAKPDHIADASNKVSKDAPAIGQKIRNKKSGIVATVDKLYDGFHEVPLYLCSASEGANQYNITHGAWDHSWEAVSEPTPAPAVVFAGDYESLSECPNINHRVTWGEHCAELELGRTLILGNPDPIRTKDKRITELEEKRDSDCMTWAKFISSLEYVLEIETTVGEAAGQIFSEITELKRLISEKNEDITALQNELMDVKGERDAVLADLEKEKAYRKSQSTRYQQKAAEKNALIRECFGIRERALSSATPPKLESEEQK